MRKLRISDVGEWAQNQRLPQVRLFSALQLFLVRISSIFITELLLLGSYMCVRGVWIP
jgi:hypothetical protein